MALLGTLGIVENPASLPVPVVHAELQLSAAQRLFTVRWLQEQVAQVPPDEVTKSPWPRLLAERHRESDQLLVRLAELGLDERRLRLEKGQVALLIGVLEAFARHLGHDPVDPQVQSAARQSLLAIEGSIEA